MNAVEPAGARPAAGRRSRPARRLLERAVAASAAAALAGSLLAASQSAGSSMLGGGIGAVPARSGASLAAARPPAPAQLPAAARPTLRSGAATAPGRSSAALLDALRLPGGGGAPPLDAPFGVSLESPGTNELISVTSDEAQLPALSSEPSMSDDGTRVVFRVSVFTATQSYTLIVLRDRSDGSTKVIFPLTTAPSIGLAAPPSRVPIPVDHPVISGDGQWVAFEAQVNKIDRILLWSAATGKVVDVMNDEDLSYTDLASPSLSDDGTLLAFRGLPSGSESGLGYFVLDRSNRNVVEVGLDELGNFISADQFFGQIVISGDGGYVAYSDVAPRDRTFQHQVWRNKVTFCVPGFACPEGQRAELVSQAVGGGRGDGYSLQPAISRNGGLVAYASSSTNLVAGDTNGQQDIFRWTPADGNRIVSSAPDGTPANDGSSDPAVSASGRHIAFASAATNLVPGDHTGPVPANEDRSADNDIFVVDTRVTRIARVNVAVGPAESAPGTSRTPALSASGQIVAFSSTATDLVRGDKNGFEDVFLRVRQPAVRVTTDPTDFGAIPAGGQGVTRTATVTSTGGWQAVISDATLANNGAGAFFISDKKDCQARTLLPGESCQVKLIFVTAIPGKYTAALVVTANTPTRPNRVRLTGSAGAGTIRVNPTSGPPGIVTIVTGTGFVEGNRISLRWSVGITPVQLQEVRVQKGGTFTAQMLVLPHDVTGVRVLIATPTDTGAAVPPSKARFTVSVPTGVPPLFGQNQLFRDPFGRVIVLRR